MSNKEYTIFITCRGGQTYNINSYNNIIDAKQDLYSMIDLEKRRNRPYYVFNDFYENEYPASLNCKIFCLKERKVTDWEKYSKEEIYHDNIFKFPCKI